MKLRSGITLLVAATVAACGTVLTIAPAEAASCALVANIPYKSGDNVHGVGGRTGCSDKANSVAVAVYHKRWHWDNRLASAVRSNVGNDTWTVVARAKEGWEVYTKTNSSTGSSAESGTLTFR